MQTGKKQANQTSWKPGESGNLKGRPQKEHSITATMRAMMDEDPEIKQKLVSVLFRRALRGDLAAIKMIWQYLDGMPSQSTDITSKGQGVPILPIPIFGGLSCPDLPQETT